MTIVSKLSTALTISLSLAMINCSQVQANQFACGLPKAEAKSTQFAKGTAKGELIVDNKIVPLNHAYAIATDKKWQDNLYLPSDKTFREGFTLLLTEREIPDTLLHNLLENRVILPNSLLDNSLRGMRFTIESPRNDAYSVIFLYPPVSGFGLSSLTDSLESGNSLQIKGQQITGEISGSATLNQNFKYKVSFKVPIQQRSFLTNVFTGQAALSTSPIKAYLDYIESAKQNNLDQMRRYLHGQKLQDLNKFVSEMGEDKFFSILNSHIKLSQEANQTDDYSQFRPFVAKLGEDRYLSLSALSPGLLVALLEKEFLKQRLYKVAIRGGESKIVLKFDPNSGMLTTFTIPMMCDGGSWKL
ncbi:hypothetical protein [Pseudanabaena sp. lw0831]|uniref:hypothetical protein n=1 Tax=Pseudanabaena sp. lw0831 TaxID=1357935 RepID=UPI001915191B|nr:hypothetical protein [Pseudanabaena sp. lw0831]